MSILKIARLGHPVLQQKASIVKKLPDVSIKTLIENMTETGDTAVHAAVKEVYDMDVAAIRNLSDLSGQLLNDARFNLQFSCEHDEFTANILENQILLFTLVTILGLTMAYACRLEASQWMI